MSQKILLKRSSVVDASGNPKLPDANSMDYGEIAVNYAAGAETLSIKNSSNEIVTFSSDNSSSSSSSNINPYHDFGVYIQATDGTLYKTEDWDGTKTPNAIAFFNIFVRLLISLSGSTEEIGRYYSEVFKHEEKINYNDYCSMVEALMDFNGEAYNRTGDSAYTYCTNYTFPDGKTKGYLGSAAEFLQINSEFVSINKALEKCGGELLNLRDPYHTSSLGVSHHIGESTTYTKYELYLYSPWLRKISINYESDGYHYTAHSSAYVRPIAKYYP